MVEHRPSKPRVAGSSPVGRSKSSIFADGAFFLYSQQEADDLKDFYDKLVQGFEKNQKKLFVLLVLINIAALVGVFRIHINTDFLQFIPSDSHRFSEYQEMTADFETSEQTMFLVQLERPPETAEEIAYLRRIQDLLKQIPGVSAVMGPVPEKIPVGFRLVDTANPDEKRTSLILKFIENLGELKNIYQHEGKTYALFTVMGESGSDSFAIARRAEEIIREHFTRYYATGDIYLESKIFSYILRIILILPPAAIIILLNVFRSRLRSFKASFFSLLPAGLGALWTLGLMGWSGRELSVMTVLAPIFTIVMGSADGLHFVSHFLDHIAEGRTRKDALTITLKRVGVPMILTTVTTIGGFMASLTISSTAMRQLVVFASIGVTFAGVATWYVLPLIGLRVSLPSVSKKDKSKELSIFRSLIGKKSIVITLVLVAVFIWGVFLVKTDFNMTSLYKPWTEVRKNLETVQRITGGGIPVFVVYRFSGDPYALSLINNVLSLEKSLVKERVVTRAVSVYDAVGSFYKVIFGSSEGYPENTARVRLITKLLGGWKEGPLGQFLLTEKNTGRFIIFPRDLASDTLKKIERFVVENSGNGVNFSVVGIPYAIQEMNDRIVPEQLRSLAVAFALMFLIMWITQRALNLALLSLLPVGITLVVMFGFMGYARVPLSIVTSTMANITIGVGIDYAIHFISLYRFFRKEGKKPQDAADEALNYVAKPVTANAFGLAAGLSALFLSPLMIHNYVALLMWVTMLSSSFLTLVLLPSILTGFGSQK